MARTILRDRSGDLVRSVQLADRTGIVAASAPKAAERRGFEEIGGLDFTSMSGQLDVPLVPAMIEVPGAGEDRRLLRRVRRGLLVAAAAVMLLGVGWIGGDTFGFDTGSDPQPAVAAGAAPNAAPAEPVRPAPSSTAAPRIPEATTPAAPAPATTKTTQPVTRQPVQKQAAPTATSTSGSDEVRTDTVEGTTSRENLLGRTVDEQVRQLFEAWSWNRTHRAGDFDEEHDRSARSFGPFGR